MKNIVQSLLFIYNVVLIFIVITSWAKKTIVRQTCRCSRLLICATNTIVVFLTICFKIYCMTNARFVGSCSCIIVTVLFLTLVRHCKTLQLAYTYIKFDFIFLYFHVLKNKHECLYRAVYSPYTFRIWAFHRFCLFKYDL